MNLTIDSIEQIQTSYAGSTWPKSSRYFWAPPPNFVHEEGRTNPLEISFCMSNLIKTDLKLQRVRGDKEHAFGLRFLSLFLRHD
jgi:hypothetical protein